MWLKNQQLRGIIEVNDVKTDKHLVPIKEDVLIYNVIAYV